MADAKLVVQIVADATNAAKGLDQTGTKAKSFGSKVKAGAKVAAVALVAVGAAAIGAAKAAAEDAQSQALLANAMKKNAGASKSQIAATEAVISKMSLAAGVADDELRPAMSTLVTATGSVSKSQAALKQALDISAATGKPVAVVSKAIAKGYGGSAAALGKLVPGLDKATVASGDMTKIMGELAEKTGGASAAAADTAAGKMKRMQIAMDEAKESVGAALLPAMGSLATVLGKVAVFLGAHPALLKIFAVAIVVVAVAVMALNLAMTIMAANPIVLAVIGIVIAIGLLAAGLVYAYKRSAVFRAVVKAVFAGVKAYVLGVAKVLVAVFRVAWSVIAVAAKVVGVVARAVFNGIKLAIMVVVVVVKSLGAWFGRLKMPSALRGAIALVKIAVGLVVDGVKLLGTWLGKLKVPSAIKSAVDGIKDAVQHVIDAVQSLISWLGRIKIPKLPGFLGGGGARVDRSAPMVASGIVAGVSTVNRAAVSDAFGGGTSGRGFGIGVTVNVYGALDPEGVARQIGRLLGAHDQRHGSRGLRVA